MLHQMENWGGLKKYKSAYLTANNWLKRKAVDKSKTGKLRAFGGKKRSKPKYGDLTVNR